MASSQTYGQVYFDESGHTIDQASFNAKVQAGGYTFIPTAAEGVLKSLQLKRSAIIAGAVAPDFSVSDINGKTYRLSEMKGRTVVLNCWFTKCAGCIQEMPDLNKLAAQYKNDSSVVFLAVTFDPVDAVKQFLLRKQFNYNMVCDQQAMIAAYDVNVFPINIVIDTNGKIKSVSSKLVL
jgi:peroxiredoxin